MTFADYRSHHGFTGVRVENCAGFASKMSRLTERRYAFTVGIGDRLHISPTLTSRDLKRVVRQPTRQDERHYF